MKKMLCALSVGALLICSACAVTLPDSLPPLSGGAATPPLISEAPETPSDFVSPDNTVETKPDYSMEITQQPSETGQNITYVYVNNTGSAVNILAIPLLEKMTPEGWKTVEFAHGTGFCGTPDCLAANSRSLEWTLDTEMLYGGPLDAGLYRLSFDIVNDNYNKTGVLSSEFNVLQHA